MGYIWRAGFRIPAGWRWPDLARECEAHDGLHFERLPESWEVEIIEEACACGAAGARLKKLDAIIVENEPVRMWRNWQTRQI